MATTGVHIVEDTATPTLAKVQRSLLDAKKRGALKAAEQTRKIIHREVVATYPHGQGGLAQSFKSTLLQSTSGKVTSAALSDSSYAGVQNRGGTIRPKVRKNLAIPLRQHERTSHIWPRNFEGGPTMFPKATKNRLMFLRTKKGNKILAFVEKLPPFTGKRKKGHRRPKPRIEAVYLLRSSITLRGTNYLERARRKAAPAVQAAMGAEVKLAVRESGRGK